MKKVIWICDDTAEKSDFIRDVIGNRGYGEIIVDKLSLNKSIENFFRTIFRDLESIYLTNTHDLPLLAKQFRNRENALYLYTFANFVISKNNEMQVSIQKIFYIHKTYALFDENQEVIGFIFPEYYAFADFIERFVECSYDKNSMIRSVENHVVIENVLDISRTENFIPFITGAFSSRYFNSLEERKYTVVKKSRNVDKIKSEYTFYHLLPDDMKSWFVLPYDYKEEDGQASYTMERLFMTDIAVKWTHGSIGLKEFDRLMDKYFSFFDIRHQKKVSEDTYWKISEKLYVEKVRNRIHEFKQCDIYRKLKRLLSSDIDDMDYIDVLYEKYLVLKEKLEAKTEFSLISVIGHGDPCFANALYNNTTMMLKFIDPKGALLEADLWTDPYYDIAKLSHSVCGGYDFFNSGLFSIELDSSLKYVVDIAFDFEPYKLCFKEKLEKYGFDYHMVRIYEVSLFLSMLPLHIDQPQKVLGFMLNAEEIMEEIEHEL